MSVATPGPGRRAPMALVHATVASGGQLQLPWNAEFNALAGSGRAGAEGRPVRSGQLVVFGPGDWLSVRADGQSELEVLILGGQPVGERVARFGPFVMNTKAELGQAVEDFQGGRSGTIPPNALTPCAADPNPVRAEHTGI